MSSFDSANGPSVTVCLPWANLNRTPFELGWRPSVVTSTPALIISLVKRPISPICFGVGATPSSEAASALCKAMNRRVVSPAGFGEMPMSHGSVTGRVDLDVAHHVGETRCPCDRFLDRLHPENREARRQLVRRAEGARDDRALAALELEARALRARPEAFGSDQRAGLGHGPHQLPDPGDELQAGSGARLPVRVGPMHHHEPHRRASGSLRKACSAAKNSTTAVERTSGFTLCV